MRVSLQYKLLAAFMAVVVLVLAGVGLGGFILIRDYFIANKRHELTDKAYEMVRMVNSYYDGLINYGQLCSFVNSVDTLIDARVWVVDQDLKLITVSEEQMHPPNGRHQSGRMLMPSPMRHSHSECELPGAHQGGRCLMCEKHKTMMQGCRNMVSGDSCESPHQQGTNQSLDVETQAAGSNANVPAKETKQIVSGPDGSQGQADLPDNTAVSLTDITGMADFIQTVREKYGQSWSELYYHPYYDENVLVVAVPLQRSDSSVNGTVMLYAPLSEMDDFLKQVYVYLAYAGMASFLFAGIMAVCLARSIVQPLKAMREAAAAMARGDYGRRVAVASRDEVGDLGRSLNSLAEDMGEYVQEMELNDTMRRDFVANVSHELRTPLTILHGYNHALQDGTVTDPEKIKKYHSVMGTEILRLEKLIADLLDLSQLQATGSGLELEEVPLEEIVYNVSTLLKQKSEEQGILLTYYFEPRIPPVNGDGDRLTQLVLILLDNAVKFTPVGGEITTRLTVEQQSVVLSIADTGIGMAEEDLPFIWERFYKADKSRASRGTGLGLAIARQIIDLHKATVEVTSSCGKGTVFIIRFPLT